MGGDRLEAYPTKTSGGVDELEHPNTMKPFLTPGEHQGARFPGWNLFQFPKAFNLQSA